MLGELFLYKDLLAAFETKIYSDNRVGTVIFIGGLTDGFLTTPYLPQLARELGEVNISLTQFISSSSYRQFGTSSLASDARELAALIEYLQSERGCEKIFLLGHSTGCQDIFWYLTHEMKPEHRVYGANCHAPVSDRDFAVWALPEMVNSALPVAQELIKDGHGMDRVLPQMHDNIPMTPYRFHSLFGRLGDDDFFSSDLTLQECKTKFPGLPGGNSYFNSFNFTYSLQDEYVPEPRSERVKENIEKLLMTYPFTKEPLLLPGNHNLSSAPDSIDEFCRAIRQEVFESFTGGK